MVNLEHLYNSYKDLDQQKTKDLLRRAGGCPKEEDYPLPHSYSEFLSLVHSVSPLPKEDLLSLLRAFNPNCLTRKSVEKYLLMGDTFSEEEMKLFMRMIPFDKTDSIGLREFIDFIYEM